MNRLSPLNFRGLIARQEQLGDPAVIPPKPERMAREVSAYECPDCESLYRWEEDALDCCDDTPHKHDQEPACPCPICGADCIDFRDAADCCIWKDFDAKTRWAMADQVEAGSTWAELLLDATQRSQA